MLDSDALIDAFAERGVEGERPWRPPSGHGSFDEGFYLLGDGNPALEVCVVPARQRPRRDDVRELWRVRQGRQATPLLLIAPFAVDGSIDSQLCGPTEDDLSVREIPFEQAVGIAAGALAEPSGLAAVRYLREHTPRDGEDFQGIVNQGMFAAHTLRTRAREMPEWPAAAEQGAKLRSQEGRDLVRSLGFTIEQSNTPVHVLRAPNEQARAVAIFLDRGESPDTEGGRFGDSSALSQAFTRAERDNVPFVIFTRGSEVRLYAVTGYEGVGRKGQAETYVQANVTLLADDELGFLPLIFSAEALLDGGTFERILNWSRDFSADLSARLRERVYKDVVPALAIAVAQEHARHDRDAERSLDDIYEETLVILFRLLFLAYAEDRGLLPYATNEQYRRNSLKATARALADRANEGKGWKGVETTSLWTDATQLFEAIDVGNDAWGVPPYNGGLFSPDPNVSQAGAAIDQLRLTDERFGPPLSALLIEQGDDGLVGPVDFRSLSVRDFGTIYEGLLESSLSVATSPLIVDQAGNYVIATPGQEPEVPEGGIYFHNQSGKRKATGSYFTKDFAVEHLLTSALEPAIEQHLVRVRECLADRDSGNEQAARAFFDFRFADLAMGSGHFLVAAVDRTERRLAQFLDEHTIPGVEAELDRLRAAAINQLGDTASGFEIERRQLLRRQIARRCAYGVDRNHLAVELARLSLWVHTFVPGLPLSFLNHNLVAGDALTGVGTIDEAVDDLTRQVLDRKSKHGQINIFEELIEATLRRAEEPLRRLGRASDATKAELREVRAAQREAEERVEPARKLFDLVLGMRQGIVSGFAAGVSLDAIEAHPEAESARRSARQLRALHFPIAFPEVFLRDRPGFDCLIGNPPWEEITVEASKFWNLKFPGLRALASPAQKRLMKQYALDHPDMATELADEQARVAHLRSVLATGPYETKGGDPDLYKFFAWRYWQLARRGGTIGLVLPQGAYATRGAGPWRLAALQASHATVLFCRNVNEWLFTDVNPGYSITLTTLRDIKTTVGGAIEVAGTFTSPASFNAAQDATVTLDASELREADELMCLPRIEASDHFALFKRLLAHPAFGAERSDFIAVPATELHASQDSAYFRDTGDPVYNHLNIGHFNFDAAAGEFALAEFDSVAAALQVKRKSGQRKANSPFSRMPAQWASDPSTLPCRNYRIALRDVVHASNPRKVWAALVPPKTLLTNKAPYLLFPRGDVWTQAYVLGMLNSSVCDWFGHLRILLNLNFFILNALPLPIMQSDARTARLVALSAWLATREVSAAGEWPALAANLAAVEREDAVAEIDAIASLMYGLADHDLPLIWNEASPLRPSLERVRQARAEWE